MENQKSGRRLASRQGSLLPTSTVLSAVQDQTVFVNSPCDPSDRWQPHTTPRLAILAPEFQAILPSSAPPCRRSRTCQPGFLAHTPTPPLHLHEGLARSPIDLPAIQQRQKAESVTAILMDVSRLRSQPSQYPQVAAVLATRVCDGSPSPLRQHEWLPPDL